MSVFLASFSLAESLAQMVAGFQVLNEGPAPVTTPSQAHVVRGFQWGRDVSLNDMMLRLLKS
jgi:hypothetical protein